MTSMTWQYECTVALYCTTVYQWKCYRGREARKGKCVDELGVNPRGESGLQIFIRNIQRFIEQRGGGQQWEHFLDESKQAELSSVQALTIEFIIIC